ncbi:hypothetical protein [Vibrio hyugaensis]|uniref:hypothetical protein n=1 Tax=Vibrio hyugaensis TaxID=1534743 RepID=UPI0011B0DA84|nr:hypothetical protein [Vibrio hyugaensis]
MYDFDLFLKNVVLVRYSRNELINKLTKKYDDFKGLDPVTMSRWVNGITTPSIQRQILVAHCADSMNEYVQYPSCPELSSYLRENFQLYTEQFDMAYYSLAKEVKQQEMFFFAGSQNQVEAIHGFYLDKMSFHKNFKGRADIDVEMYYLSDQNEGKATSFLSMSLDTRLYLEKLNLNLDHRDIPLDNSIIVTLSFFSKKRDFKELAGCLLNRILFKYFDKEGVFLMVRGYRSMAWFDAIGAKKMCLIERSDLYGNVYLYYIKTKQFFGNASIFRLVKESYKLYESHSKN